jgi:hypothetical protein
MNDTIASLCHTRYADRSFDLPQIIKVVDAADMNDSSQFHDMMHALFGETESGSGSLFDHLHFAQSMGIPESRVQQWANKISAPKRDTRKNEAKIFVLMTLRALVREDC